MDPTAQVFPARYYMRPVVIPLGSRDLELGGSDVEFQLKRRGLLSALVVHVSGTYTVDVAKTLAFGPFGPGYAVKRFTVDVPDQPSPFNINGAFAQWWSLREADFAPFRRGFMPPDRPGQFANATYAALADAFPTIAGAGTMHQWYILPFQMGADDPRGALPLGNDTTTYLRIQAPTFAELFTNDAGDVTAGPTLTVEAFQVNMTSPGSNPILPGSIGDGFAVTYDQVTTPIVSVNDWTYVPTTASWAILGIMHAVVVNGVRDSSAVESIYFRVQESYFTEEKGLPGDAMTVLQAAAQEGPWPEGLFVFDQDLPVLGRSGWIGTAGITEIETGIRIASGATLGTDARVVSSVRRLVNLNPASSLVGAG